MARRINTAAIQKTIDAASAAGGGIVLVPEGNFLTGPFTLASQINLHLAKGATILISDDMKNYPTANDRYQDCISVTATRTTSKSAAKAPSMARARSGGTRFVRINP